MITADLIRRVGYTGMTAQAAADWAAALNAAAGRYGITTPLRQAHFLAQLMHESGGLRWTREIWGPTAAQRGYEGRVDLGNTRPGDGQRYMGRGPIQLTGRGNYQAAGFELGLPLVEHPELVERPNVGALVAARYFARRRLQGRTLLEWADTGATPAAVFKVSQGVNGLNRFGQPNHLAERQAWFGRIWRLMQPPAQPPRVLLVPKGGGEPVPCTPGPDVRYSGTVIDEALISQLRLLYPQPGGPWQYSPGLTVYLRRDGDLVLERAMNTGT